MHSAEISLILTENCSIEQNLHTDYAFSLGKPERIGVCASLEQSQHHNKTKK